MSQLSVNINEILSDEDTPVSLEPTEPFNVASTCNTSSCFMPSIPVENEKSNKLYHTDCCKDIQCPHFECDNITIMGVSTDGCSNPKLNSLNTFQTKQEVIDSCVEEVNDTSVTSDNLTAMSSDTIIIKKGGYGTPLFSDQLPGPEDQLKNALNDIQKLPLRTDSHLIPVRDIVIQFYEGLPNHLRGITWIQLLGGHLLEGNQSFELFIENGQLDELNQLVIQNDVKRTRSHLELFKLQETRQILEIILTYFCKKKNYKYKQGLNEVLAPFFYIKCSNFPLTSVVNCFSLFVTRFLPFYEDDQFGTLQSTFFLFRHLVLYHDPYLGCYLDNNGIVPELYVTPWFLTLFASTTQMNLLLCLWDFYISENDPFLFFFIALALLLENRDELFCKEISLLPETLTHIGLNTYEHLHQIWDKAKYFKYNTPSSFRARIANIQNKKLLSTHYLKDLECEDGFHIWPHEVLIHCYGLQGYKQFNNNNVGPIQTWKLFLLDVRSKNEFDSGRLPLALSVDIQLPNWKEIVSELTSFGLPPSTQHVCVPESSVDTESLDMHSKQTNRRSLVRIPFHICIMGTDDLRAQRHVAHTVFNYLVKELFLPCVSIVKGGYVEAHKLSVEFGLDLVDHDPSLCIPCRLSTP